MRKIKFRAWNGKTMVPDVGIFGGRVVDSASRMYDTPNMEIEEIEKAIPMQFTGLLDRNGKEVYEGDIVDFQAEGSRLNMEVQIPDCFQWNYESQEFEVIGNIHQNPELLTRPIGESA